MKYHVEVWAYCLMDNHVHLVLVPATQDGLAKAMAETNRSYTWRINSRYDWRGYLWQGRFSSFVMDENYLMNTLRYVENNPVRAGIVSKAWDYLWSSARCHANGAEDKLLTPCPKVFGIEAWKEYLIKSENETKLKDIRKRNICGLPLGEDQFIEAIALKFGVKTENLKFKPFGRPKKS